MSRIGKKPITIPTGVTVSVAGGVVDVKGPKGQLQVKVLPKITVEVKDNTVVLSRRDNEPQSRAFHGLIRSLIASNIVGVTDGYKKALKLVGTGYRVASKGAGLSLSVGFSHPVEVKAVQGVKLSLEGNDTIHIEGTDKQLVGQVTANIRAIKPPEPYKGKGVRYIDEEVKLKPGKAAV